MKPIFRKWFRNGKARIHRRLARRRHSADRPPMISTAGIHYDVSTKTRAHGYGGIGLCLALARRIGLVQAIDQHLHLLRIHQPYHESDHVLNLALNALCGGECLQDLERLRNDADFLDAVGAASIPDPTTAGDFCRRFTAADVNILLDAVNLARRNVWAEQPDAFFDRATIDMDGTLVETTGRCKQGMDVAYDGTWGYHPLVLSLAETREVLSVVNRSGNRPSHEGAHREVDRAVAVCFRAGFRTVLLRGDTDFSQTERLDGWAADPRVRFIFGYDAKRNLTELADGLPPAAWRRLSRPVRGPAPTGPRARPEKVKDRVVRTRGFETLRLQSEEVAEFEYQPTACARAYRMVVVRKNITRDKGEQALFDEHRYFFYLTNEREWAAADVVFSANDRCDQENLIAQLKGGVSALGAPVDTLEANWAYMVMTALGWNLKAWWGLCLPEGPGRWADRRREEKQRVLRMEFKAFAHAFVLLPCQVVTAGRRRVYRLLSWRPLLDVFFRLTAWLRC